MGKRAVIEESSTSSEAEVPTKKRGKPKKWGKLANPELAFDLENEANPSIIEMSSNATVSDEVPKSAQSEEAPKGEKVKEENAPKESSCPEKPALPVIATVAWLVEKKGPSTIREETHAPKKIRNPPYHKRSRRAEDRREVTRG